MAKTTFTLTHSRASDYRGNSTMPAQQVANHIQALLQGCMQGAYGSTGFSVERQAAATVTLSGTCVAVAATGTVTLGGGAGDVTIVTDGTSVGPVAFNASDAQTATDCITALNANGTFAAKATASSGGAGVVLITWDTKGTVGNSKTLTASRTAGTATASGATLSGGENAVDVVVNGNTVSVVNEGSDDAATAALLKTAINADGTVGALVTATQSGTVVTLTAVATGAAGDAYTLTASGGGAGTATRSGATFSGGAAVSYTW